MGEGDEGEHQAKVESEGTASETAATCASERESERQSRNRKEKQLLQLGELLEVDARCREGVDGRECEEHRLER